MDTDSIAISREKFTLLEEKYPEFIDMYGQSLLTLKDDY